MATSQNDYIIYRRNTNITLNGLGCWFFFLIFFFNDFLNL